MRTITLVKRVLGLGHEVVVCGYEVIEAEGRRPHLVVRVRLTARARGRCGRCGVVCGWYDAGGGERRWRHVDSGYATVELAAVARRVGCPTHGPTVAQVPWARHDSAFSRAFEDLVVYDAIGSNKTAAARRHGVSWRAVDGMCTRLADEALAQVDLLGGLVAIAIDEVKYKKGQRYLTVVCDHVTGRVVWAGKGRSKKTVGAFFDQLGAERAAALQFVTCDGAEWIHGPVARRAQNAIICLDTFHIVSWATVALDEVRRHEWNELRRSGGAAAAKALKGLRFLLRRNWENLTGRQRAVIRELDGVNRRLLRAWQLKEELRAIFTLPLLQGRRALDHWLVYATRSRLAPFVKLARTIRTYRASIEATIEWKLTNGISESNNASIGRIRTNARGFHDPEAFIKMILLDRAGIAPKLPWAITA